MSESDVARLLSTLVLAYGKEPPTPEAVDAYLLVLGGYSQQVLRDSARVAYGRHTWLPKPSELKVICDELQAQADREGEPYRVYWRALRMWNLLASGQIAWQEFTTDRAIYYMRRQYGDRSWWRSNPGEEAGMDTKTDTKPAPADLPFVYERCPACGCKQYFVIEGDVKTCMACHTEYRA